MDEARPPQLLIDQFTVQVGNTRCSTASIIWKTESECHLPFNSLSDLVLDDIGLKTDKEPSLTLKAKKESGNLKITTELTGVFKSDGMLTDVTKRLEAERQELTPSNLGELEIKIVSSIKNLFDDRNNDDPVEFASKTIREFTEKTLPELMAKAKDNKNELDKLAKLTQSLNALPDKMKSLRARYRKLELLKKDFDKVMIVSAKVTYDLNEVSGSEPKKPTIKAYIVDIDKPKDESTSGGAKP